MALAPAPKGADAVGFPQVFARFFPPRAQFANPITRILQGFRKDPETRQAGSLLWNNPQSAMSIFPPPYSAGQAGYLLRRTPKFPLSDSPAQHPPAFSLPFFLPPSQRLRRQVLPRQRRLRFPGHLPCQGTADAIWSSSFPEPMLPLSPRRSGPRASASAVLSRPPPAVPSSRQHPARQRL